VSPPVSPGPGSWSLDAAHCERPHSRFFIGMGFDALYTEGLRASAERYGLLVDTVEARFVDGFIYTCPRPIGAPPDAQGTPPRWLIRLACWFHPAVRARLRRAEAVLVERPWRADVADFRGPYSANLRAVLAAAQRRDLSALTDAALQDELDTLARTAAADLREHFHRSGACMLPVGDFLAHVTAWTGDSVEDALRALTGASPDSVDAVVALDAAADAVRGSGLAPAALGGGGAPLAVLTDLRAQPGPVGEAVGAWLDLVSERTLTGHDVAELRGIEVPGALLDTLRARVARPGQSADAQIAAAQAADALRARVPASHRAAFDALLAEAREAHALRDARSALDFWCTGLVRRALLEVGRRLTARGALRQPEHAVDCTAAELRALLGGGEGPSAAQVALWADERSARSCADMPDTLGHPPAPPPPPEWYPPAAARIARAFGLYLAASAEARVAARESASPAPAAAPAGQVLEGIGASSGRVRAPVRVVRVPEDFSRVSQGDILVARITTPAYNALLPLLAGLITERGGALSHPAIVAREYGLPAVVGVRGALDALSDGTIVEVDGSAGTVRVLG